MGQLSLYLSHSASDNEFSQSLAWALRGAGAEVWFDRHVVDGMSPGWATLDTVRTQSVFLLVLSPAALDSTWVWNEYRQALFWMRTFRQPSEAELSHIRKTSPAWAAIVDEQMSRSPLLNVIAAPLSMEGLPKQWQLFSDTASIGLAGWQPYPEREAIERTVRAVARLVPTGAERAAYARAAADYSNRLALAERRPLTADQVLAALPAPLESDFDVEELIARGKTLGEEQDDQVNADSGSSNSRPLSIWCLVANIAEEQPYDKDGHEVRRGTKHFAPGAKVYCMLPQWGDGYEAIKVIGHHRGGHRFATLVMPSKRLTNWRADLVYSPHVIHEMEGQWDGTRASKQQAEEMAQMCREREAARQG